MRHTTIFIPENHITDNVSIILKNIISKSNVAHSFDMDDQLVISDPIGKVYPEIELILIEHKIPFDTHTESDLPTIRYYRPENDFYSEVWVTNHGDSIILTESIYHIMRNYLKENISKNDLLINISNLISDSDPILTGKIKPLADYIKKEERKDGE